MVNLCKFRAWHKELKIMRPVYNLHWAAPYRLHHVKVVLDETDYDKKIGLKYNEEWFAYPEKNEIELMQFTGLTDVKGVPIFMGDICYHSEAKNIWIEWMKGAYVYAYKRDNFITRGLLGDLMPEHELEVIGNIYANPDLLEAKCD